MVILCRIELEFWTLLNPLIMTYTIETWFRSSHPDVFCKKRCSFMNREFLKNIYVRSRLRNKYWVQPSAENKVAYKKTDS